MGWRFDSIAWAMSPASADRMESSSPGFSGFSTRMPKEAASGSWDHFARLPPKSKGSLPGLPSELNFAGIEAASGLWRSIAEAPEHATKRGFFEESERIETLAAPSRPQRWSAQIPAVPATPRARRRGTAILRGTRASPASARFKAVAIFSREDWNFSHKSLEPEKTATPASGDPNGTKRNANSSPPSLSVARNGAGRAAARARHFFKNSWNRFGGTPRGESPSDQTNSSGPEPTQMPAPSASSNAATSAACTPAAGMGGVASCALRGTGVV